MPGPARLVTEADVSGSCGGRGAQRQLCRAAAAPRLPQDKAAWAGVGAAKAGKERGGRVGPGTQDPASAHLPVPARPQGPECWQEMRGCGRGIGRSTPPSLSSCPSSSGLFLRPLPPRLRAEGRLTTGSRAQPRIPAFLPGLDPAEPQICGRGGSSGAAMPAQQEAAPETVPSFPPEGNPEQRNH